jgi:branched-chain amino acid transport system substrate-binding protein
MAAHVIRGAALLALVLGLAVLGAAVAGSTATPGVTADTIELGTSGPLTGEAAAAGAVLRGSDAYFKFVNAHGGVLGRKIDLKILDDAYDPAKAVANARQLLQQDQVFALFGTVGTNNNLAIRDFVNASKVPMLFVNSGATTFGRDYRKYPWTIGYLPTYSAEGKIYARHILLTNAKRAKIAVLYQNDDYGHDLLTGLEQGLGKRKGLIKAKVSYEPTASDVESQVAQLKASGANTLCLFAFGKFAIQAFVYVKKLGWKPQIYVNDVASASSVMALASGSGQTEGAISIVFGKDPATPAFAKDPGVRLAGQIIKRYAPGESPKDGFLVAGMASAFTLVDALKKAGKNLTREGVMKAATSLTEANNPFVIPGVVIRTTPTYRYPLSQVRLQRWTRGHWLLFGGLLPARP